jgi:protoporphyrinogen/coproporphyrinogen III oxidase
MRVAIVGGGITGLAAAYYLQEGASAAGTTLECTLIERDNRLGGKVVTHREDGFTVEGGPDSFLTQKPWAVELCRRLGLEDRLVGTNEASRKVSILWKGQLRTLPDGVLLIVPTRFTPFALSTLISPMGKLRMGLDLIIPRPKEARDESVASFVRRRLGNEALDKIAEPLMGGIHTSDPERQSLLATFPRFSQIEQKYGSLIKGMLAAKTARPPSNGKTLPAFMTLRDGLEQLPATVAGRLKETRLALGRTVTGLRRDPEGPYRLKLDDGTEMEADEVVLAMPAREVAPLISGIAPDLAERLGMIRYVSTATVSFGYRKGELGHPLNGFGFVIPKKERRKITGCTWSSTKFDNRAPAGHALVRCFVGSATDDSAAKLPEEEMAVVAREELRALMGVRAEPVMTVVYRWRDAHPQYDVGHLDRMSDIDSLCAAQPGLHLAGSSYRGVGLPDCIHSGQLAAESILKKLAASGGSVAPTPESTRR